MTKTKVFFIIVFALICVGVGLLSPYVIAGVDKQEVTENQINIMLPEYNELNIGEIYDLTSTVSYVGSWRYTQVGEGDTGLSDGDIFNMTINEDKTISMTLYNAVSGQTDNVDLSQADITETDEGLKLSFQEGELHLLTLVDDNTLHVSLYDDSIKFDAIRVVENAEITTELQTGTYKAMMDDGYSYSTFTLKNENGNQILEYIDYGYDSETETFTQSEILTGTFSISDGVISILLEIDEIPVECEIVENGFVYQGSTFTYQK